MQHLMAREIETIEELLAVLDQGENLSDCIVQGLSLESLSQRLIQAELTDAYFLGCEMTLSLSSSIQAKGGFVFPPIKGLVYKPFRPFLYTASELYDKFDWQNPDSYRETLDYKILEQWRDHGGVNPKSLVYAMSQRLHDESITNAAYDFLRAMQTERRGIVAIMGGHDMLRSEPSYLSIATMSWLLTRAGYVMVSGGGPGAMEATHVGAWFADRTLVEMEDAIAEMSAAPLYKNRDWLSLAFKTMLKYPTTSDRHFSLGVPTWLYGHEPPTPFASHIAKYFANSLREDGLVTIATGGIIYAPGSAGTIQEIFQDLTQNHYLTTGMASAMVFYGVDYWTVTKPVYPLVKSLAVGKLYQSQLAISDDIAAIVEFITTHKPLPAPLC